MDNSRWYRYYQRLINPNYYERLIPHLIRACSQGSNVINGIEYPMRRISCVYGNVGYSDHNRYSWTEAPSALLEIRQQLENYFQLKFDYVLAHVYRNHEDYLGLHNDKEAMNSHILSVSLGATRRFQFRSITGEQPDEEFKLSGGDVIHMLGPVEDNKSCQHVFKHQVPKMNIEDLCEHIESHNITLPSGRKTYKKLNAIIESNLILPIRINLTFRQLEPRHISPI